MENLLKVCSNKALLYLLVYETFYTLEDALNFEGFFKWSY